MQKNFFNKEYIDTLIVGGGIIGCSILHFLVSKGIKNIALIDKGKIASGTTGKSGGFIRIFHPNFLLVKQAIKGLEYFSNFSLNTGLGCNFTNTGFIWIKRQGKIPEKLIQKINHYTNYKYPILIKPLNQIPQNWSIINNVKKNKSPVIYDTTAGYINPSLACKNWIKSAKDINNLVEIYEDIEVLKILHDNGVAKGIITNFGNIKTKNLIIATGFFTNKLLVDSNLKCLDIVNKYFHYNIYQYENNITIPVIIDIEKGIYIIPQDKNKIMAGLLFNDQELVDNKASINQKLSKTISEGIQKILPEINSFSILSENIGIDSFTKDYNILIKASKELEGCYTITGSSSGGIKMAPFAAQRIYKILLKNKVI